VQRNAHLTLVRLWEYSRDPNPATLGQSDYEHLLKCEDCVAALWVCNISASVEDAEKRLGESRRR